MSTPTHSPLPWSRDSYNNLVDANGEQICIEGVILSSSRYPEVAGNNDLVDRAVNAHESLYEALKALLNTPHNADIQTRLAVIRQANEALAKAAPAERKG